ncbi:type IV pilus biogenesis protein PilM [Salmonella enterica]|nr:type IV pilus biogenesis protein PilM [Salmonella enterica]
MKSLLIISLCILVLTFWQKVVGGDKSFVETSRESNAALFLNYVTAFDSYFLNNGSATGDVTTKITLPMWLPNDGSIRMYISGGYGYVFMPSSSGLLSEIMKSTDNSLLVGFSDSTSIVTLGGRISKPAFIPPGYIVYLR